MEELYQQIKRKRYDYIMKCNKNEIEYGDELH